MSIPYDTFTNAFLMKIQEYEFMGLYDDEREAIVDDYMKKAFVAFKKNCKYDFATTGDDLNREFCIEVPEEDLDEIVEIVSEGMLTQWMKPYLYKQENLENILNTRDFTTYSPAELLKRVGDAFKASNKNYIQMIREYSYNHGELDKLHI